MENKLENRSENRNSPATARNRRFDGINPFVYIAIA